MNNMIIRDDKNPQHHKYKSLFAKYSWWLSVTGRIFVIVYRYHTDEGDLESFDILEKDTEVEINRPYLEIFNLYKAGTLMRTSVGP